MINRAKFDACNSSSFSGVKTDRQTDTQTHKQTDRIAFYVLDFEFTKSFQVCVRVLQKRPSSSSFSLQPLLRPRPSSSRPRPRKEFFEPSISSSSAKKFELFRFKFAVLVFTSLNCNLNLLYLGVLCGDTCYHFDK